MAKTGFLVPTTISGSYVSSKRNEEGSYDYQSQVQNIGIEKQAALQSLGQSYENVINNAYSSYLASQKSINTSVMGQGYKEAYRTAQQEAFIESVVEANASAASTRAEIEESEEEAIATVQENYQAEVANMDRLDTALSDYYTYLQGLTYGGTDTSITEGSSYFADTDITNKTYQDMYEELYSAQPRDYYDENEAAGMSFAEYVRSTLDLSDESDLSFSNWAFYQGGYSDYLTALQRQTSEEAYALTHADLSVDELSYADTNVVNSFYNDDTLSSIDEQLVSIKAQYEENPTGALKAQYEQLAAEREEVINTARDKTIRDYTDNDVTELLDRLKQGISLGRGNLDDSTLAEWTSENGIWSRIKNLSDEMLRIQEEYNETNDTALYDEFLSAYSEYNELLASARAYLNLMGVPGNKNLPASKVKDSLNK